MLLSFCRGRYPWVGRGCLTLRLFVVQHPLVRLLVYLHYVDHQLESDDPLLEISL